MSTSYSVAFRGELLEGFDVEQVRARVAERFRLPAEGVAKVFAGRRVVLKRGLDAAQADAYVSELAKLGLRVVAESDRPPSAAAGTKAPASAAVAAGVFRILYAGEIAPGCVRDEVIATARRRLKLGEAQLALVFSGRDMTLKAGLDENAARRYLNVLGEIGMYARCDPALPDELPTAPDDVEQRLLAAMNAEFELPSSFGAGFAHKAPKAPTDTDLAMASHQMVATVLNADAMAMYEGAAEHAHASAAIDSVAAARFADELAARGPAAPAPEPARRVDAQARAAAPTKIPAPPDAPPVVELPPARPAVAAAAVVNTSPDMQGTGTAPRRDLDSADSSGHALAKAIHGMVMTLFVALLGVLLWVLLG